MMVDVMNGCHRSNRNELENHLFSIIIIAEADCYGVKV